MRGLPESSSGGDAVMLGPQAVGVKETSARREPHRERGEIRRDGAKARKRRGSLFRAFAPNFAPAKSSARRPAMNP